MNWRVDPSRDSKTIRFELSAIIGQMVTETSILAAGLVKDQDREKWLKVAPKLVLEVDQGVNILRRLGSSPSNDLTDEECRLAHRACCFLAILIRTEASIQKDRLVMVLQILSAGFRCQLMIDQKTLPPWKRINGSAHWPEKLQNIYSRIRGWDLETKPVLPLSDCCCLLFGLPDESRDDLPGLVTELWRISDSHRQALGLLLGANQ